MQTFLQNTKIWFINLNIKNIKIDSLRKKIFYIWCKVRTQALMSLLRQKGCFSRNLVKKMFQSFNFVLQLIVYIMLISWHICMLLLLKNVSKFPMCKFTHFEQWMRRIFDRCFYFSTGCVKLLIWLKKDVEYFPFFL